MYSTSIAAGRRPYDDAEADFIPLITGSVAEFYIEPMLPLAGDIDVMYHWSNGLAIPRGHSLPTQLPDVFHNYVKVFEILDSGFPGYVFLELRYLLTECIDSGTYSHFTYDNKMYFASRHDDDDDRRNNHGPALRRNIHAPTVQRNNRETLLFLPVDFVRCVRCLLWPLQAADWPTRHRNYDWPDSATVELVVNNGCDVVPVAHRQCRQHEVLSIYQWRLSFSRAEIVLINSWIPVQQIVYHMLRFFVKTELLANCDTSEAVSNYHIKTLMMWACELKSRSFWTDNLNLIRICVEMLHTLSVWLTHAQCQHYFINNCNLMHHSFSVQLTAIKLNSIDSVWLSTWFVNNYIHMCSMLCPDNISSLFIDVSMNTKLKKATSAIISWRISTALVDMWRVHIYGQYSILCHLSVNSPTVRLCTHWMTHLSKIDNRLYVYFTVFVFLHVANKIPIVGFTSELMDTLATVIGQSVSIHRHPSQCSSVLSLSKATKLMKVVANSSHSTMQLIEIELSKAYLYRVLRCTDSDSDSIYCLANVYLAALYYTSGQYQMAIDHCTLVMRSQDHSQCSSRVVQGELLPKIDDDIDAVLGLVVFYQYVRTAALNQRQTQYVNVFTTELFAHYLYIKCLSITKMSRMDELHQFRSYISSTQLFTTDVLAVKSVALNLHCQSVIVQVHSSQQPTISASDLNTSELVELLQQSAVEHLTAFRQLEARDFSSVATIVTTDFEALYAYKRGDYQRCLELSKQNVQSVLDGVHVPVVWTFSEFIQLMDDDLVSLIALTLIADPEYRHNSYITQLTLSLYLMIQCQCRLKLRHSVTSLAQTLDYIELADRRHPVEYVLNHLTLKFIQHKVLMFTL